MLIFIVLSVVLIFIVLISQFSFKTSGPTARRFALSVAVAVHMCVYVSAYLYAKSR